VLFRSGFEPDTTLQRVGDRDVLIGTDHSTGYAWNADLPASRAYFQYQVNADDPDDHVTTRIEDVAGRDGPTRALYQEVRSDAAGDTVKTRNNFLLAPPNEQQGYIRYRIKLQEDFLAAWPDDNPWRIVMEWMEPKPAGCTSGNSNYRIHIELQPWLGAPSWVLRGEQVCPVRKVIWEIRNPAVAVPIGEWFDLEAFWRYGDEATGRAWFAVDGVLVADHVGSTQHPDNPLGIDRWFLFKAYGAPPEAGNPAAWKLPLKQWIDDVELRHEAPAGAPTE
jgi:hypothetical protein